MLPAEAKRTRRAAVVPARALILAAALALAGAGCGDEDDEDGGGAVAPSQTQLAVTLDPDGPRGERPVSESLSCEGATDDSVCAGLDASDLDPVAPGVACTEIYGGPDEVRLEGTLDGVPVDATFTRANGCEIDRFERILPLLRAMFPDYTPGESLRP